IVAGIISLWSRLTRPSPPKHLLQIAVVSFYGNSDAAIEEGRGLRTVIRNEITRRSRFGEPMRLVGELDAPIVADITTGNKYGEFVLAHLVVGGDVTMLGKEVKFQPLICVVCPFG